MLYSVFIAICTATTPVQDCDRHNARHWIIGPASHQSPGLFISLSGCQIAGQQYAAQSRLVAPGTYVKVFCQPTRQPMVAG